MRLSQNYFFTKKENDRDEDSISGNLLVRSGMIKKIGSGIYAFLPMGLKVMHKIENVIREEMDRIGSLELVMPSLLPEDYYVNSGRREVFGDDMFSLKDRAGRDYVLGPTHEELFVEVCRDVIHSYKDMPISLYQMANKYRDEARSRYGLIRTREFVMKDAYTFDKDLEGLDQSYQLMFDAYQRIFDRLGLEYKVVRAATGAMGGLLSEEFQAITDIGEDIVVSCKHCDFATNIEVCECGKPKKVSSPSKKKKELFHTPNCGTIADLENNYSISPQDMCKTLIYKIDDQFYAFMVRGDREVNESKISQLFDSKNVILASFLEDEEITGAAVGFAGPIDLSIPVIIDYEVLGMDDFLVGANRTDYHYQHVSLDDFTYWKACDIRNVCEGDPCPVCGSPLEFRHGIEVGNTFKLGTKYSVSMGLSYLDSSNQLQPVYMGSYGIGPARILAAIVEQNHDENGILFPEIIAPYDIEVLVVDSSDERQMQVGEEIYQILLQKGYDVLLDDRDVRAGAKFKDSDLIGIPKRIVVGRGVTDNKVEFKTRSSSEKQEISIQKIRETF